MTKKRIRRKRLLNNKNNVYKNPNTQSPNPKQDPISKHQRAGNSNDQFPNHDHWNLEFREEFGHLNLVIGFYLGFGDWDLEFFPRLSINICGCSTHRPASASLSVSF